MDIILLQHVEGLGDRGEIVKVARGYYRNYLGPKKLAMLATDGNRRRMAEEERVRVLRSKKHRDLSGKAAEELNGLELEFRMKVGEDGQLFASVNALKIAQELGRLGKKVASKNVLLEEPIKALTEEAVDVAIRFPHEVTAQVKVSVVKE
ncbi:MAG: 50S ribosomal protein L9 [Candidatus Krumholzibacteria bacterium]|jgi:large subunit ribosomal protein L9|nr:50S ribosomal protein L9 [Candidatus Krumholzibacteria bacterium]MDP6669892.1 50S ribosomal protein L9 [Candidatus Krumholzibacteria bacterium]MDP6797632.1 50S ribosomal protein L9 [Candidatus Krumholzibacteria bacterium]MDP7021663.1 50S ribosomal protein L9 [Candidatus Krumholzibacteria bacterium]